MQRKYTNFLQFLGSLAILAVIPAWCQTAVLTGKVVDAVHSSGVIGADIVVVDPSGKEIKTGISGDGGVYKINELPNGKKVIAKFRKGGYAPDPRQYEVELAKDHNIQDAKLFVNTADSIYWGAWANDQKTIIYAQATSPQDREMMLKISWDGLETLRLSPEARVEAAHQLAKITPQSSHSGKLLIFANTEMSAVDSCRTRIQTALQGTDKPACEKIPPEVANDIAVDQILKESPSKETFEEFIKKYRVMFGDSAAINVQKLVEKFDTMDDKTKGIT